MEHVDEQVAPGDRRRAEPSPWRAPAHEQRPAPWLTEPTAPTAPTAPQGNPVAVWSWVVAVPCAVLGLVLGVVGLVRARRRGGAGLAHAVVGTALSVVVLLVGTVGLAVGTAAALAALAGGPDGGPDSGSRSPDGTVTSLSGPEQAFIDDLYEETYQGFDDATLLDMAYGFCAGLDAGQTPAEADAVLVARWADEQLGLDAAYDVEWSATETLCQEHAEEFQAWDPSTTDGGGTTALTAAVGARP